MAIDNPSYFSLSGGASSSKATTSASPTSPRSFSALFRRRTCKMGAATSSQSGVLISEFTSNVRHESRGNATGTSTPSTPTEERVPMLSQNGAINPGCGKRRSFRNLFRSVSANAEHERTQKFLKGDPRPSDVAPPSPYLPHRSTNFDLSSRRRSHSHSEKDRRHPGRTRRVLKSASELLSNDMIYCGVASNSKDQNDGDDDNSNDNDDTAEVFFGVNDARYYNVSSTLSTTANRRRHSIGTFLGKETGTSGNIMTPERQTGGSRNLLEADTAAAPVSLDDIDGTHCNKDKQPSCNRTKRRRHKSTNKGSHSATVLSKDGHAEDDVVFVSSKESEASNLWVNYLTACFEQISRQQGRPPFKVRHIAIEEPIVPKTEQKIRSSRLQIVIVCPVLLERVRTNPEHSVHLTNHLVPEKVLAMMLGVHDSHINNTYKSSLVSCDEWRKFFVKDQDETFVGELLGAAVAILGTMPPPALRSDKTAFSVHPKKVKLGQNKIIVLLNDPLSPKDNVSVIVDRCGDAIDISNVKRRNPYALQFSIPERCLEVSMLVGVRIIKNGCSLGVRQVKCESRLRELDQILRAHDNPLEFMCQTFGFSSTDREKFDNWMVHAFQKNMPPHFNLLSTPNGIVPTHKSCTSPEENPTLLHFAARFGLEKLAWQLLECPGGDLACDLKNVSELTPADLAEQAGHARLAHQLQGYMQMNEFTNMYSYLKVISQTNRSAETNSTDVSSTVTHEINNEKEDYCRPRPLSEAYSVPPIARPVTILLPNLQTASTSSTITNPLAANYSVVPTPTLVINNQLPSTPTSTTSVTSNGLNTPFQDYMKMHAADGSFTTNSLHHNVICSKTITTNTTNHPPSRTDTPTRQECPQENSLGTREDNCGQKICQNLSYGRTSSNSSTKSREPSGPQDELLEIINDFKNNVFTISEVERLVENWQKRNDVQQSFKDKQRQLMAMREEYDKIQKQMKEEMKTPTPFDKIRKFFSKGKKETKESAGIATDSSTNKSESINGGLADRRPVSSLSLRSVSSSSSSGRMSTVSGCSGASLGDSGTHSDSEDRRLQNVRDEKTGMTSYEIPPAPKPFTGRYSPGYSPSPSLSIACDLDLRQTQSPSRVNDNEYYIAFPPSGLPVHAFKTDGSSREPGTPNSLCEHPMNNNHDFVQNVTVSSDKHQEEIEATKLASNNSYTNIDPAALIFTPIAPTGMCIPDYTSNESTSNDSVHVDREAVEEHINDTVEACSNITKVKPPFAQCTVDEVDSALRGQETTETIRDEEHVPTDSANISKNMNEITETKMPEYMNLAVNMSHDAAKVLGAIPKKLPAPPVPLRGTTFHTV
ncbi:PREDICTED: phosphoinositide 3-kinase adapter protein 1 isoform X1 [Trachymyrmex septentrionalis]|uniref:phosphoinositide 3-kinase adapter protein 1 isoform X1 n=1 Tax=Trachymyrmex septentrionalis TaxID=34720 RepID=UPI00084F8491|nr:PREDICTED: phosphoinositide 3-kinase adapter protein 1 isoform X1 [Trachymyrmex septentrionalis]